MYYVLNKVFSNIFFIIQFVFIISNRNIILCEIIARTYNTINVITVTYSTYQYPLSKLYDRRHSSITPWYPITFLHLKSYLSNHLTYSKRTTFVARIHHRHHEPHPQKFSLFYMLHTYNCYYALSSSVCFIHSSNLAYFCLFHL